MMEAASDLESLEPAAPRAVLAARARPWAGRAADTRLASLVDAAEGVPAAEALVLPGMRCWGAWGGAVVRTGTGLGVAVRTGMERLLPL
jgi:hypothetical protein